VSDFFGVIDSREHGSDQKRNQYEGDGDSERIRREILAEAYLCRNCEE
jgi:hypothetical protein